MQYLLVLGYGEPIYIEPQTYPQIDVLMRLNAWASIISISLGKLAFGFTLIKVLPHGYLRHTVVALSVSLILVAISISVLAWKICLKLPIPRNDPEISHCWIVSQISYLIFIYAWQVLVDFMLVAISIKILIGLSLKWPDKIGATIAMSVGLM